MSELEEPKLHNTKKYLFVVPFVSYAAIFLNTCTACHKKHRSHKMSFLISIFGEPKLISSAWFRLDALK